MPLSQRQYHLCRHGIKSHGSACTKKAISSVNQIDHNTFQPLVQWRILFQRNFPVSGKAYGLRSHTFPPHDGYLYFIVYCCYKSTMRDSFYRLLWI